jgi:O-methyltransferase
VDIKTCGLNVDKVSLREVVMSTKQTLAQTDTPLPDIDNDPVFNRIFAMAGPFSMTAKEAMYSLYLAVKYVIKNKIPGDFVECGVWQGGSAILAALTFREIGDDSRTFWLYDTYEGMTEPTEVDIDSSGGKAFDYIEQWGDDGKWVYADLDKVKANFEKFGLTGDKFRFIAGDVLQTIPRDFPKKVSILRLDTDWYESTKVEMEYLYPKLSAEGVLIVDDYGHWAGSRKAVDEYFSTRHSPLLNRINIGVRFAIKPRRSFRELLGF